MPRVQEVACRNTDCEVDMFSIHYVSSPSVEEYEADYACPECGERDDLDVLGDVLRG